MAALASALLESWWVLRSVGLYILGGLVLLVVLWSLWLERNNHTLQKGVDSLIGVSREAQSERVILHSQVEATLTIYDAWLDLQAGFVHLGKDDGRPTSSFFPLVISPSTKAGILFGIRIRSKTIEDETEALQSESILNIEYGISGSRTVGAHAPVTATPAGVEAPSGAGPLLFRSALLLQKPVLNPCLAVGFLPFPTVSLRVGQLVTMRWRVERLKDLEEKISNNDEVLYEVKANPENWMIAGRKRGFVSLSTKQGSRIVISIICVPLVSGYVRPPQLSLPDVGDGNISCNPPGPHLVCVLPPTLSSSFCVRA